MVNAKNEFLSSLFGPVRRGPGHLRYWLLPDCTISADDINTLLSFDVEKPQKPDVRINVVKSDNRTRVLRFQSNGVPLTAKIFSIRRFRVSRRHRRYAFSELWNNTEARRRGINTPLCCAFFEKRSWGLVSQSGVIMETLVDYTELTHLLDSGKRTLFDVIAVIKELYQKGVNHIDVAPRNVFLRQRDNNYAVIDWQYCSFHRPRNDIHLCLMAAKFLNCNNIKSPDSRWQPWLKVLFEQCRPDISCDKLQKAVDIMQNRKLHLEARLELDALGLGVNNIW
jgi:hypothetical protein